MQLADGVHLGKPPQVMQVSVCTKDSPSHDGLDVGISRYMLRTTEQDTMTSRDVKVRGTFTRIVSVPFLLRMVTEMIKQCLLPVQLSDI